MPQNKKIGQFFECSRECHQPRKHALKNQRSRRRQKFRMNAVGNLKKQTITRHGIGNACATQHR